MTRPALVASSQTRDQPRSGDLARPILTSWSHLRGRAHDGTGAGETEVFYCILKCHLSHFRMFRKLNDGYLIKLLPVARKILKIQIFAPIVVIAET